MKEKFSGGTTLNARIKIDYSGKKPRVTFSYPDKKNQHGGTMFFIVFYGWVFIFLLVYSGFLIGESYSLVHKNETEINQTRFNNYSEFLIYFENNKEMILNNSFNRDYKETSFKESFINTIKEYKEEYKEEFKEDINLRSLFFGLFLFAPPLLIYFPFKKKWANIYPKWMALFGRKKYAKFKPRDVQEFNENYYCEIPLFENVLLNYEATKDFSKYLDFFEIREHKFTTRKKRKGKLIKVVNDYLWYAKFYFTKKPKTGDLKVEFR